MTKGTIRQILALLLGVSMLAPAFAFATGPGAGLDAQVNTKAQVTTPAANVDAGASASATVSLSAKDKTAQEKANQEIDRRIQALTELQTRLDNMARVTESFKQSLSTNVQNQITGLTQLKAKIDSDTDETTLKADVKSVDQTYRIFVLVLPMSRIAAAADREVTIISMMTQLGAKLQARLQAAQQAGANTSELMAALTDLSNKLSDANTQSHAAVTLSASLTPDNGDTTKMKQNTEALKTARTDIQAGQKDLVAARADIKTIVEGLAKLPIPNTSASSTTSTSAQTQTQ